MAEPTSELLLDPATADAPADLTALTLTLDSPAEVDGTDAVLAAVDRAERAAAEALSEGRRDAGIEILVDLAKQGQIDPWHVDILDVTDKYLRTLDLAKEQDLRLSGRALFYAAVLLRLKSEALEALADPDSQVDDDAVEFEETDDGVLVVRPPAHVLDGALTRRTSTKQPRKRPTTLAELIAELQRLEQAEREARAEGLKEGGVLRRERAPEPQAPIEMAHDEDIQGDMERVVGVLRRWIAEHGDLTLAELLVVSPDRVGTFLALLFLDAEARISLVQEVCYGEVRIVPEETLHAPDAQAA